MKILKWAAVAVVALVIIVIGGLLVIPMFVDVQKYKPEIERQVSQATGSPFAIGGELKLSLFPWAGVAFTDLRLGNPPGFKEKDLLTIRAFDAKVKLLPLLSKDIQVDRFVVEGLRVVLEKNKGGKANWEAIGKPASKPPAEPPAAGKKGEETAPLGELPIRSLAVGELAVRNASLLYVDAAKGERMEIGELGLEVKEVSLERPIRIALSAKLEGQPVEVAGKVGPLGRDMGKGPIPVEITVRAFRELTLKVQGAVIDMLGQPGFDLALDLSPFSPRKLASAMGQTFPAATSDPAALTKVSLRAKLKGGPSNITLTDGAMDLDQSKILFSAAAREFAKPDVSMKVTIDEIDLDRYLPPATGKKPAADKPTPAPQAKKTDYGPLRKLVVDAEIRAGKLKVMNARVQDLTMKLKGKDGVFTIDPFSLAAYEGSLTTKANLDLRSDKPRTSVDLQTAGLKVRPLLSDLLNKEFLEGTTQAKVSLRMEGEDPEAIKRTLNGSGELRFIDGAVIGIDLPGMARNLKAAFGGDKTAEKPRTDFTELVAPFTIKDGVAQTPGASMASPLLRVVASGKADLVRETVDMRVEPKLVPTLKGQQDTRERSGVMVPVLVSGTFSSPQFAPDLKGMLESEIKERLSPEGIGDLLKGRGQTKEGAPTAPAEKGKEILKGLFGR